MVNLRQTSMVQNASYTDRYHKLFQNKADTDPILLGDAEML